jgi:predicted Ser/Thr protein kinase
MSRESVLQELKTIADRVQQSFAAARRLLSFSEYMEVFEKEPVRYSRDAVRYVRDMFEHYGRVEVKRPWGTTTRFSVFDLPFEDNAEAKRGALVGQELVQQEIFRALSNFVREGRPNRVMLMHGPNGSAKSTVAACMMRGLEHYSSLDEGALYRFHWIFPNKSFVRGAIGFQGRVGAPTVALDSYAHLTDEQIDARLQVEVRDHPLFLIPEEARRSLLERLYREAGAEEPPPDWILRGNLSHKNRQIFEGLLAAYQGSLEEVLRHVQVERYFISRRYRVGAVTLGPQLSVDAGERQVTADRSVAALPTSLQSLSLFEVFGELVDAAGGLLEFSDLLKRPLDAYKYLQITAETGEIALRSQNLRINCVMIASGNEIHLAAFREHPEYDSFRGRLEPLRVPYLLSYSDEKRIYDEQIAPQVRKHVAPHATDLAAMFAVLTRMRKPEGERYPAHLKAIVEGLTAAEKMDLYATGNPPKRLEDDAAKALRNSIPAIFRDGQAQSPYEGQVGASPREMRTVLLDAAQNPRFDCLSPFAVLEELERLCDRTSEYGWLQEDKLAGGYHDHAEFRTILRSRLLDAIEDEFRVASNLVDEGRYNELFERYVLHVSYQLKGEKLRSPVTGEYVEPDERLMQDVERLLGVTTDKKPFRASLINLAAAWAIEHPGQPVDNRKVFATWLQRLRDAAFAEKRSNMSRLSRDVVLLVRDNGAGLDDARRKAARALVDNLQARFGYEESSAVDAALALARERFDGGV